MGVANDVVPNWDRLMYLLLLPYMAGLVNNEDYGILCYRFRPAHTAQVKS